MAGVVGTTVGTVGTVLDAMAAAPWALWLLAPLVIPVVVAIVMWWRGRPRRPETTPESIAGHRAYLQALDPATRPAAKATVKHGG